MHQEMRKARCDPESNLEAITIPARVLEILGEFGFCGWLLVKGARISAA